MPGNASKSRSSKPKRNRNQRSGNRGNRQNGEPRERRPGDERQTPRRDDQQSAPTSTGKGPKVYLYELQKKTVVELNIIADEFELVSPRLVTKDVARHQLPATTKAPPNFLRVTEYLQMDIRR